LNNISPNNSLEATLPEEESLITVTDNTGQNFPRFIAPEILKNMQ
jgi:hypothetical protein